MKKAFTLAEMMIVLVVIAVITAILLPAARHATPDENILKFKKAHNTLYTAIRELVNSDKYYLNGDLGIRANSDLIDGTHDGDVTYLCNTIADVIGAKNVTCSEVKVEPSKEGVTQISDTRVDKSWGYDLGSGKARLDKACLDNAKKVGVEIELADNIIFYQSAPNLTFGITLRNKYEFDKDWNAEQGNITYCFDNDFAACHERYFNQFKDENGFSVVYKFFCIDIDGIDKGEDPFGYGIRVDGKIVSGARADEWLEKSINKKD